MSVKSTLCLMKLTSEMEEMPPRRASSESLRVCLVFVTSYLQMNGKV